MQTIGKTFEEIQIGDTASFTKTITETDEIGRAHV